MILPNLIAIEKISYIFEYLLNTKRSEKERLISLQTCRQNKRKIMGGVRFMKKKLFALLDSWCVAANVCERFFRGQN